MDFMPEASSAPPAVRKRYVRRSLLSCFLFLSCYLGGRTAADVMANPLAGQIVATVGVIAFGWLLYEFWVLLRQLDELQQRIHLTALAIGFGSVLTLICAFGLMSGIIFGAGGLKELPWMGDISIVLSSATLPFGLIAYYAALHFVKRRYE
ncbi:MAG: hypothetical protein QNJ40_10175 [Xanthomonadales bacterium]|nr:hypothetical protein [Xanthomonadales bacterium]